MSVVVDDLHFADDPDRHLATKALAAGDTDGRLILRVPDRASDGVRAFRAHDVARMLQRHGRIREIAVTDAGTIVAAADTCERRGEVAVWTGYAIGPWHPSDIVQRGLGGSETAAVRLADELARLGYAVTLYGQFEQDGMAGDVLLRDFREFDPSEPLEALIGFRDARLFDERPNARFCALWLEDLPGAEQLSIGRAANVDRVCAVSGWHKAAIEKHYPWIAELKDRDWVVACRNGIEHDYFTGPAPEREKRVVYTSSPDRGLDVILECWAEIKRRVPDAEFISTYSRWYDLVADIYSTTDTHRKKIDRLSEQDGCSRVKGGLGQRDLARLMRSATVWCHPSWYSIGGSEFHETSCISAMEAQAAGCVVVASNWGALTETVQFGSLVDGSPVEPESGWRETFIERIVAGLTDPDVQQAAQTCGPEAVAGMDWQGAAEQLAALFAPCPDGRGAPSLALAA